MKTAEQRIESLGRWAVVALLAVGLGFATFGCDSGDDDGNAGTGDSTVMGNVASFSGGGVAFVPKEAPSMFKQILGGIMDAIVPSAYAAVGGVSVSVNGADIGSVTEGDGFFVLSGVPAGEVEILFSLGASSGILVLEVPANATIELRDVTISEGSVSVGQILVQVVENVPGSSSTTTTDGGGAVDGSSYGDGASDGASDGSSSGDQPSGA